MSAYMNNKPMHYKYERTHDYMKFVKEKYQTNYELFSELKNKKGIIKLRKIYFEECNEEGHYIPKLNRPVTKDNAHYKLILPVGLTGFGKTTVGNMLKILYDIGYVQNNSIKKKVTSDCINDILQQFITKNIVMLDKINHTKTKRKELLEKLNYFYPSTLWTVALRWNIKSVPENEILEFVRERVEERGENHEVITPEKSPNYPFFIKMMLNDYNDIDLTTPEDSLINEVIDIDFKEDSVSIVKKIIKTLDLEPKSQEEIENAYQQARAMKIPEEERKEKPSSSIKPTSMGLSAKYISGREIAVKFLENYVDQNKKYSRDLEQVKSIITKCNFIQRDQVQLTGKKNKEAYKYYDDLIGPTNKISNFNNPDLEALLQISSIVWTSNAVIIPIDIIESDKLLKNTTNDENGYKYLMLIAYTGNDEAMNYVETLTSMNNYYKNNPDHKPSFSTIDNPPVIDESFVLDDTNKDKENEIIHPNTYIQLLPQSLKNTSFIKPVKIVEGPHWKQLFFEPFKIKSYFTKYYY